MKKLVNESPLFSQSDFSRIFSVALKSQFRKKLKAALFDSPLGEMLAIADDEVLFLLEFTNRKNLEGEIIRLCKLTKAQIVWGSATPVESIKRELDQYFLGNLKFFKTPVSMLGTPFQIKVWKTLQSIPLGKTWSYASLAHAIGKPTASRAVALANSKNQFAIIVPCHRVIKADGSLCGYGAGIKRKEWLIQYELGELVSHR